MQRSLALFTLVGLLNLPVFAASLPENITAMGQGIVSPSTTSLVNINRGLLGAENPAGLMYVDGFGFSYQMTKDTTSTSGYEASLSNKSLGLAIGSYETCTGCDAQQAVLLAGAFKWASIGARYQTVGEALTYGLGVIFNHTGKHRVGVHAENNNPNIPATSVMRTGYGYSYVGNENIITLEMSQLKTETTSFSMNSLSYKKKLAQLEVSMTYEMDVEASTDSFWMGAGFKGQTFSLAVYAQYKTQLLAVLSAFF